MQYIDEMLVRDRNTTGGGHWGKNGSGLDERILPMQDANYNTVCLAEPVNLTCTVVQRFAYTAYGEVKKLNPNFTDYSGGTDYHWTYLYTGRHLDEETGLYFYRARYYHCQVGRFGSRDPIGYLGGMNLYGYVGGNPLISLDPLGLTPAIWTDVGKPRWRKTGLWQKEVQWVFQGVTHEWDNDNCLCWEISTWNREARERHEEEEVQDQVKRNAQLLLLEAQIRGLQGVMNQHTASSIEFSRRSGYWWQVSVTWQAAAVACDLIASPFAPPCIILQAMVLEAAATSAYYASRAAEEAAAAFEVSLDIQNLQNQIIMGDWPDQTQTIATGKKRWTKWTPWKPDGVVKRKARLVAPWHCVTWGKPKPTK